MSGEAIPQFTVFAIGDDHPQELQLPQQQPIISMVLVSNADMEQQQDAAADVVAMSSAEAVEARLQHIAKAQVPVPITVVRTCLAEFEQDLVRRLLVRYAGSDVLPNGWRNGPSSNGIQVVYGAVDGSSWFTMKTTGKLRVSAEKAARILMAADMVPKYDDMTKEVRLIERLSDATEVRRAFCRPIMLTAARDFCVATTYIKEPTGRVLIATRSVDHPEGEQSGYCRAVSHISGYVVTPDPVDPEHACELAIIAHMDLGGHLPAMVVKYLGLSAPIKIVAKVDEITYHMKY